MSDGILNKLGKPYKSVYKSSDLTLEDFKSMMDVIQKQTEKEFDKQFKRQLMVYTTNLKPFDDAMRAFADRMFISIPKDLL